MGHWVLSLLTHCRSVCAPCASPLQGELCTDPLPTHWHISHSVFPRLLTSNWGGHSLIASVCFFSLFVVASAGSPSFTGFCYEPRWVLWFLPGLHPFWFSLHLCLRILLGFPFVDPMPTHRLISRRDRFFFVLWTFQSNTEPLRRHFFCICELFCGLLEPEQLSPTDEISVLGFELAPFFLGKRVLLTDFTVRKQGEC